MPLKILMLAGAPESRSLNWDPAGLLSEFQAPIAQFAGLKVPASASSDTVLPSAPDHAVWRSLPLHRTHVPTGFSQQHELFAGYEANPRFFTTATASSDGSTSVGQHDQPTSDELLSQFYDHSLAVFNELPSSQLGPSDHADSTGTSLATNESSFLSRDDTSFRQVKGPLVDRGSGNLSDLEDIPAASYITSIQPQTMTVNLVVGIISVAAPRTVRTRWGSTRSLVELLVGDETRSGFAVTFWLSAGAAGAAGAAALAALRRQDVVLLQNVALGVFTGRVYGHSLKRGVTRAHLLYRRAADPSGAAGYYTPTDLLSAGTAHPQLDKTRRVRQWVIGFVAGDEVPRGRRAAGRRWDEPPEDSQ